VETLHLIARDVLRVHEYTIIMVGGIYNNRDTVRHWNTLKLSARFRVSIDLYHCGLLFIRTGQAAQHFKIRI
jgi:hypothetical protein